MSRTKKDNLRTALKTGFVLLGAFYVYLFFFNPMMLNEFVLWLNASSDGVTVWLDAVRAASAITCATAMISMGRLMLKFPTVKRFYAIFAPLPVMFSYYISQLAVDTSEVVPRYGFVMMNTSATFVFAGVSVLAALMAYYYKEKV